MGSRESIGRSSGAAVAWRRARRTRPMQAKRLRDYARRADEPACGLALAGDDVALHAAGAQQRAPRGYAATAHSRPTDLAGEAAVFNLRAAVHDDLQAGGLRL